MLNYLSAELWRMTRRGAPLLLLAPYFLLVALIATLRGVEGLGSALDALRESLVFGLYLCFPLAAWADGDAGRLGTLKNETACGLARGRIYTGRLLAGLIAGMALFLATAAVFLAVSLAASAGSPGGEEFSADIAHRLWEGILHALPHYFGALGLAHLLCVSLRSGGVAATLYYVYITLGEVTLSAIQVYGLGVVGNVVNALSAFARPYLLSSAFFSYGSAAPLGGVAQGWLTGLSWLALTTALGLLLFQKRELR